MRFAAEALGDRLDDSFLALNGDVLTNFDLVRLGALPRGARGAGATIGLYEVDDAAAFGLVACDAEGAVTSFTEKTGVSAPGEVNAGAYVLERSVLELIPPDQKVSIEGRGLPAAGRRRPVRHRARRVLDGHRDPRSIPRSDLGHPRGQGGDRGTADRARGSSSTPAGEVADSAGGRPAGGGLGRLRLSVPAQRSPNRSCSGDARSARGDRPRLRPCRRGVTVEAGAEVADTMVAEDARVAAER